MYKKLLIVLAISPFLLIGFIQNGFSNRNNPPTGETGALNEPSCGFSNSTNTCHGSAGATANGSSLSALNTDVKLFLDNEEVTSSSFKYVPDEIYRFTLVLSNPNQRNGFSLAVENNGSLMEESFVIPQGSNANIHPQNSAYLIQDGSDGVSEWEFDWIAPAAQNGDVTFFASINRSNSNEGWSGDEIIPFRLEIGEQLNVGIDDLDIANEISVKGNPILNNTLSFDLLVKEPKEYTINVFNLGGQLIHSENRLFHAGLKTVNIDFANKGLFILDIKTNKNERAQLKIVN